MDAEAEKWTPVTITLGGQSLAADLGPPGSNAVYFLDPPSGLGNQTPKFVPLPLRVSEEVLEFLSEARSAGTEQADLSDRNCEISCLSVAPEAHAQQPLGNAHLVLAWADFARWARAEGALTYEKFSPRWNRQQS